MLPESSGYPPAPPRSPTLAASFVDVVVLRQGELAVLELCEQLARAEGFAGVAGTLWKEEGAMLAPTMLLRPGS